jgi:hypothetical protein
MELAETVLGPARAELVAVLGHPDNSLRTVRQLAFGHSQPPVLTLCRILLRLQRLAELAQPP